MAGTELAGVVVTPSGPYNGATVDAWLASRFGSAPVQNSAPPSGSPDGGPVTSGVAFGGPGSWTISGLSDGSYYVRAQVSGASNWAGPIEASADADLLHKTGAETKSGLLTLSAGLTVSGGTLTVPAGSIGVAALTGVLPIANGGTGSATQNFLDLTTAQTKAGALTLSNTPVLNAGLNVTAGPVTFPAGSIAQAAVAGAGTSSAGVDIGSSQIITGQKTFDNDLPIVGGQLLGSALTTPAAPVVTPTGTPGSTTYQYEIVATAYDGRDTIPSAVGQTTTGTATLTSSNYNALTWSAVTGAATYKVLRNISGTFQLLVAGLTATSYNDMGSASPSSYTAALVNPGGELQSRGGRFIGVSATVGPPASGTAGDWGYTSNGMMMFCLTSGNPGTWRITGPGPYQCRAYRTTALSTAANINGLTMDTLDGSFPNTGMAASGVFTAPLTAVYRCTVRMDVTSTAASQRISALLAVNGSPAVYGSDVTSSSTVGVLSPTLATSYAVVAGATLSPGYNTNTAGLVFDVSSGYCYFTVEFVATNV